MIKGLSDKRRLPRAGKLKLGIFVEPGGGKKGYPRATDYFVCPPEVQRVHGEKPKELPIMFPLEDPRALFPQDLKLYRSSGLFCKGDGERAHRWGDDGELKEMECPCPALDNGDCRAIATLNVLLPEVPGVGVWQIDTSSTYTITSLNSCFDTYIAMFGGLAGIPFILKLEPQEISRFDEKKKERVKSIIHVLRFDTPYTMRQIIEWRSKQGARVAALMPAPSTTAEDALALPPAGEILEADRGASDPPPAGTPPGEVLGEATRRMLDDDEPGGPTTDDVSMLFAYVKRNGIAEADYFNYLVGVYRGTHPYDLSDAQIAEQREFLKVEGGRTEAQAQVNRSVIEKIARRTAADGLKPPAQQRSLV